MYVQGKFKHSEDDLTDVYKLWSEVFVTELHLYQSIDRDAYDKAANYCVILDPADESKIVAAGRIYQMNDLNCKIDRIAVLKKNRGNYYADMLVRMLVNQAFIAGAQEVSCDVIPGTEGFFRKIGFVTETEKKMVLKKNHLCTKCQMKH